MGSALGMLHEFPYASQQSFDAYIAIDLIAFRSTRKLLVQISRKFINSTSPPDDDSTEPLSYRGTVILLLLSLASLFGFYLKAGMSAWIIFVLFAMYLTLATGITRMRAQLGSPVHDQHFAGVDEATYALVDAKPLGPSNLAMLSYFYVFNRAYDCLLMPHQLEGLKIAEQAHIQYRRFAIVLIFATILGIISSMRAYLHFAYQGQINTAWTGFEAFGRLERWFIHPSGTNITSISATEFGFLIAMLLTVMRSLFLWMPLHATVYAVTTTWTINVFWFSIFVSFVLKWLIIEHGSLKFCRQAAPFFWTYSSANSSSQPSSQPSGEPWELSPDNQCMSQSTFKGSSASDRHSEFNRRSKRAQRTDLIQSCSIIEQTRSLHPSVYATAALCTISYFLLSSWHEDCAPMPATDI